MSLILRFKIEVTKCHTIKIYGTCFIPIYTVRHKCKLKSYFYQEIKHMLINLCSFVRECRETNCHHQSNYFKQLIEH